MTSPAQPATSNQYGHVYAQPPPLPPRQQPEASMSAMASNDPRSSSTQSLVPDATAENSGRRKLLLVYIHGFMGNETSFQSFPAHLHNLVTITLADSHAVHTKIYPKYRSRNALEVARDDFSQWLTPHETRWTDIVLLGHSMGGLLAADIALLFRHNIIGVVNFDVPFVGMHPGIVKAGLGSIFNPWPGPEHQTAEESIGPRPSRIDTFFNPKPSDPNYNPSFFNDAHLPVRKGWENALHFINKHSNGLISASKGLVKSHFQFGGAMANYSELKERYARIRALEEDNEAIRMSANPGVQHPPRIRFVNYYTASTGRPKRPKSPKSPSPSRLSIERPNSSTATPRSQSQLALSHSRAESLATVSPRISVELHRDDEVIPVSPQEPLSATSPPDEHPLESVPEAAEGPELPEIPPIPQEPPFIDLAQYPDKAERRAAEKEQNRNLKEYQRAVKARNTVIKERSKIEERWQKQKQRQAKEASNAATTQKADSGHESDQLEEDFGAIQLGEQNPPNATQATKSGPYGNYDFSRSTILAQPNPDDRTIVARSSSPTATHPYADSMNTLTTMDTNDPSAQDASSSSDKKKRYKKFCMLPPKDASGNKDPTWIRVFMENMDEVVAHTSLFFVSDTYERLVGDVAGRIEDWIRENDSLRLVREMESANY